MKIEMCYYNFFIHNQTGGPWKVIEIQDDEGGTINMELRIQDLEDMRDAINRFLQEHPE